MGKDSNQDLMQARNAKERIKILLKWLILCSKNCIFLNILFLEGSNFLTQTISVKRPDGRVVILEYNSGVLNRLDKLTAANYTQGDGQRWNLNKMFEIMLEVARTSLKVLGSSLFNQIVGKNNVKKSD
ncbi:EcoRI family type II restriction endonuclease [Helicobacter pylori]